MKLSDKKIIADQKNTERAREVQEGMKLAKSIDVLRETYAKEQTNLRIFRENSLKIIREEIDKLLSERNRLIPDIKKLEDQRILAQAPIDLVTEWKKVKKDQQEIQNVTKDLANRETIVIGRELEVKVSKEGFFEQEEKIKEDRNLVNQYLSEASKKFYEAEKIRHEAQEERDISDTEIRKEDTRLREKEVNLLTRERDVELRKEQNEKDRIALEREKLHIASQQQSLKVAWDRIRNLKK
jgi:hypothetical protein